MLLSSVFAYGQVFTTGWIAKDLLVATGALTRLFVSPILLSNINRMSAGAGSMTRLAGAFVINLVLFTVIAIVVKWLKNRLIGERSIDAG